METTNGGGDGQQACASCRHQRKKCPENCVLAPYFPARERDKFQAVHGVFGVSNVQKMIKKLDTREKKARATESLIWEAEWRNQEEVEGCYGEYKRLLRETEALKGHVLKCMHCNGSTSRQRMDAWSSNNGSNFAGMVGASSSYDANGYANGRRNSIMEPPPLNNFMQQQQQEQDRRLTVYSPQSPPMVVDRYGYRPTDQFIQPNARPLDQRVAWEVDGNRVGGIQSDGIHYRFIQQEK